MSLLRIREICCLGSLSQLNILDLHDNQVLLIPYTTSVFALGHSAAYPVTARLNFVLSVNMQD